MRQKLLSITQSLRLPTICVLCNQFHKSSLAVCSACTDEMPLLGTACTHCACPLYDGSYLICGQCIKKSPYIDRAIIAHRFEEPLRSLLHQFKYHNALYLGSFLSQLMLSMLPTHLIDSDCLVPVPLHPQRLKSRGFNQAAVLTRHLAKKLYIPYDLTCCTKIINTAPQASLDGDQRRNNLQHAFAVKPISYQHVTLIDDLLTTGSTANELAMTLKKTV